MTVRHPILLGLLGLLGLVALLAVLSGAGTAPANAAPASAPEGAAPGAVVIGSTGTTGAGHVNCSGNQLDAPNTAAAPTTYLVPGAGVLTSVSYDANTYATAIRAVLYAPPVGNNRTLRGYSDRLPAAAGVLNTFPVRLPVAAGTSLGLWIEGDLASCAKTTGNAADSMAVRTVADPVGTPVLEPQGVATGRLVNISAVWEPDADGDGYGDVSQDACPQSAALREACPVPDTTLVKAPRLLSTHRNARVVFDSTVPGSTFTCAVDKRRPKPCVSPLRNRYSYGRHTVRITAISPLGVADPAPLEVRFKIRKKR